MGLAPVAIIVIVLVVCLAITALGAGLFYRYQPAKRGSIVQQQKYMRTVRLRNIILLKKEYHTAEEDLESRCTLPNRLIYHSFIPLIIQGRVQKHHQVSRSCHLHVQKLAPYEPLCGTFMNMLSKKDALREFMSFPCQAAFFVDFQLRIPTRSQSQLSTRF